MWETRVWSLGWEDALEKETATHSSILAWKIPWTEKPGGLQSMGLQRVRHDWVTSRHMWGSRDTSLVEGAWFSTIAHLPWFKLLYSQGSESWTISLMAKDSTVISCTFLFFLFFAVTITCYFQWLYFKTCNVKLCSYWFYFYWLSSTTLNYILDGLREIILWNPFVFQKLAITL